MAKKLPAHTVYVEIESYSDGTEILRAERCIEEFEYPSDQPITLYEYRLVAAREVRRTLSMK